jgi:hypothetical protein
VHATDLIFDLVKRSVAVAAGRASTSGWRSRAEGSPAEMADIGRAVEGAGVESIIF